MHLTVGIVSQVAIVIGGRRLRLCITIRALSGRRLAREIPSSLMNRKKGTKPALRAIQVNRRKWRELLRYIYIDMYISHLSVKRLAECSRGTASAYALEQTDHRRRYQFTRSSASSAACTHCSLGRFLRRASQKADWRKTERKPR